MVDAQQVEHSPCSIPDGSLVDAGLNIPRYLLDGALHFGIDSSFTVYYVHSPVVQFVSTVLWCALQCFPCYWLGALLKVISSLARSGGICSVLQTVKMYSNTYRVSERVVILCD